MSVTLDGVLLCEVSRVPDHAEEQRLSRSGADDSALVASARAGEYSAFEELVRRYRNEVFALSFHFVRNREEAWDIAQEVFVKAYRGIRGFRGNSNFKSWLMRITANQCKDTLKKRHLETVAFDDAIRVPEAASGQLDPSQALEASEIGEAILSGMNALPIKHRTAFVLREFEGLSYEEMAKIMGCSLGTVMSRLFHARKKLQKFLRARGMVEGIS